jgi:aspartyl-tRNA(Asn)/glutamyl-tRNA(Gln) amidotransferase subunit A
MGVNELTELTIHKASSLLAKRVISSSELVDAILDRILETEDTVHAYALLLADSARGAAKKVDTELASGCWRGPLHGIPIGIKDVCHIMGVPTKAGSRVIRGYVPSYDATVVRRLREAGAVIVGKTVTHEFAYGLNFPPTRNPWRTECHPGGSSAGSGVAVAVRSSFGAIGTDTSGSIRNPAAINGVVGLKPTYGRVSRYGVIPLSPSLDHVGPLARTVEDCALILQAIAGFDPLDVGSVDCSVPEYTKDLGFGVHGVRLGIERDYFFSENVIGDVKDAVNTAVRDFEQLGAVLIEVKMPELAFMPPVGLTFQLVEAAEYHRHLLSNRGYAYEPATRLMLELGQLVPATLYVSAIRARALLGNVMKGLFRKHHLEALITPTLPTPGVPIKELSVALFERNGKTSLGKYIQNTVPANVTGQPAISVPCGFSKDGLPIGLQLIGRPFEESTLFRIAHAYESLHHWHARRPEPQAKT